MEIKFYGGNCIKLSTKKSSVVVDDVAHLGAKSVVTDKDILLITDPRFSSSNDKARFVVDGPGEFEVSDVSIAGIAARSHVDEEKTANSTMYRVILDDVRVAIVGHVHPDLTDDELEELGTIDILCIPVGGNGYTLDGVGAQKIVKNIEPKVVIPTHYDDKTMKFEVPQQDLETALKALAMEPAETLEVLKIKNADFGDGAKLIVLERK